MNSPLDSRESRIAIYLADVDRAMPKVPKDRRDSLLLELSSHIDRLIEEYVEEGRSPGRAVDDALSMMGDAKKLGRDYVRNWYRSTEPGSIFVAFFVINIVDRILTIVGNPMLAHSMSLSIYGGWILFVTSSCLGAFIAGWKSPKGATIAAGMNLGLLALSNAVSMYVLTRQPAIQIHITPLSLVPGLGGLLAVATASITVRARMRKLAGI